MTRFRAVQLATAGALLAVASVARAGSFDETGTYQAAVDAVVHIDFAESPERFVPEDIEPKCVEPAFQVVQQVDALDGTTAARLDVESGCFERFLFDLPAEKSSYRATLWMRHGSVGAQILVAYPEESGIETMRARLFPTGRTTSDGWVELASNEFPVDGGKMANAYLRISNFADLDGTDIDALEIVPAGDFVEPGACSGQGDPACGPDEVCVYERCRLGSVSVPTLPDASIRDEVVDMVASRLQVFFGGRRSRAENLPVSLATLDEMRNATTAWQFWQLWARAIRELRDWHTNAHLDFATGEPTRRLNVCFFEGDGDVSQGVRPKHAAYPDILVSHAGIGAAGLAAGDRLVAIDGLHPIEWAQSLIETDLGFHIATDPNVFADLAEQLGGPSWLGGALILKYARTFTVVRCDPVAGSCSNVVETLHVADLEAVVGGADVVCDNRPFYHLGPASPNPNDHYVFDNFFRGPIEGTTPEEKIFGLLFDTLYGGGDPSGWVNSNISNAYNQFRAEARGVILDHRAGSGGTLDAAELATTLVRPEESVAVIRMPMEIGGYDGPADAAEGLATFQKFKDTDTAFRVGASNHDPTLPVALITHRDGSASDYMPFGMKGAPNVRIFGPRPTAGAFSTFIEFWYWGALSFQIASGDTIAYDGRALIGHGVEPDHAILPRQSDLLAGKDTLHEAALAWVRTELKP